MIDLDTNKTKAIRVFIQVTRSSPAPVKCGNRF
jgi:hypothetical protein